MPSIKDEAVIESRAVIAKRNQHEEFGTELLRLFNVELVEFVKQRPDGSYEPVDWPSQATHELIPTLWNNPKLFKRNKHGHRQMPAGYALSVCAVPISRAQRAPAKADFIEVHRPLPPPKQRAVYHASGELEGRKRVLIWMADAMGAKLRHDIIRHADSDEANNIYRRLLLAHSRKANEA